MHRRTTPKVFASSKQLHREMTPAEKKIWTSLRTHRANGVHFRNQHAFKNTLIIRTRRFAFPTPQYYNNYGKDI